MNSILTNEYLPAILAGLAIAIPFGLVIWTGVKRVWMMLVVALSGLSIMVLTVVVTRWLVGLFPDSPRDINDAFNQFSTYVLVGLLDLGFFLLALGCIIWAFVGTLTALDKRRAGTVPR